MLEAYRNLIHRFVIGDISADEFETDYLARFKDDPNQVIGEEFDILDELFADVDDYVGDPALGESVSGASIWKPGTRAETHIPRHPDGSFPIPKGWPSWI